MSLDNTTINLDNADDDTPTAPTNPAPASSTINLVDEETRRMVLRQLADL